MPFPTPVATYRLQLRNGVDLDRAIGLLPWLRHLGVSHLYLSPPFQAAQGSTHGYDVIDPTRIDPVLGGDDAFLRLANAARDVDLGIIVDIVPNHMAFVPDNPWLADVLRNGRDSEHARIFDIDWDRGRLHFPVLDGTPADLLANGDIGMEGPSDDPRLRIYDRFYPLRLSPLSEKLARDPALLDDATMARLLDEQHWSVGHWRASAADIIHRRFFNITELIGVRQEDPDVFALTHRWIIDQVGAGRIQGLRVDHIDGLARPGAYLHHLRQAVGDTPIWIEKIVKAGEDLPAWPIEGMSGYEFMTPVTRLLTHSEGLDTIREASDGAVPADYAQEVRKVRRELLDDVFLPERRRVVTAAMAALAAADDLRADLDEAIATLASLWPVYRSYAADLVPLSKLITDAVATPEAAHCKALLDLLRAPDDPLARAFAARFEQLTGALTAKSEEDTVFFRSVAYLPLCEVGSEPDLGSLDAEAFATQMRERADRTPLALNALSTHDTKRSADARAVLVALSHFPALARRLYDKARRQAREANLPEGWGLYALQTALMLAGESEAHERIADHIAKAMREAKDLSRHELPDGAAEDAVIQLCRNLHHEYAAGGLLHPAERDALRAAIETLVLAQAALQLTAPGIPDIYQGTEGVAIGLTDPDNRRAVDWAALETGNATTLASRKTELTRALLARRRSQPDLFARGSYTLRTEDDAWVVERRLEEESFTLRIPCPSSQHGSSTRKS
ncbi:malto-oligosyltrehalose synthase [Novosphingobium panipatense]|uniref:malto-oligosyltrehalose synthase n=1 Tax=Novosphingobium TaxID=165696 RepID=UPI000CDA0892|nr:malto-oligosyltrehalose synthase [Novosphingobium sp. HII-3]